MHIPWRFMDRDYINEKNRAGWDDLYEEYFEDINQIIKDNLGLVNNKELIEKVFSKMLIALDKAILRMKKIEGGYAKKEQWFIKSENLKNFSKQSKELNKKVISINLIDQFLRSTY